jgi:hypothetical protein
MGKRLLGLRDVPEDELDGMQAQLDAAGIRWYRSAPGLFGLSPAALWIEDPERAAEARALIDAFQAEHARRAREAFAAARAAGEVPGLWASLRRHPLQALGLVLLVLGVLFALSLPMLELGR